MKKRKENKIIPETLDIISKKMMEIDYFSSFGVVILKNGIALKIRKMYEYFHESWILFNSALSSGDTELARSVIHDTNGGVISNGEMTVNLSEVSAMVAIHEMVDNDKEGGAINSADDFIHLFDDDDLY